MIKEPKIFLGIVSETSEKFINQVKLCISSFRRNAGNIKNIPIVIVTNNTSLEENDRKFFENNFSPIIFTTKPRINIIPPASKLNIFESLEMNSYDIILYMDCDTVVLRPLDGMLSPILNDECDFLCRRGGNSDRGCFVDIENTINFLNCGDSKCFVSEERPKFNTGVFAFRNTIADKLKKSSNRILPMILNREHIRSNWMGEQCSIALSCVENDIRVSYLDEIYNSWGNLEDIRILHCFKSRYKFDRKNMFENFDEWKNNYGSIIGEKLLIEEIEKFIKDFK